LGMDIEGLSEDQLWEAYGAIHERLREVGGIRSRNITGDRGEQVAIDYYTNNKGLPRLQQAPPSTKNIDAISTNGERYSIKTVTWPNKTTGVFHGYGKPEKPIEKKNFEYLIIVILENYMAKQILELKWEDFYHLKRWHSTDQAYNITINKAVLEAATIIYKKHEEE